MHLVKFGLVETNLDITRIEVVPVLIHTVTNLLCNIRMTTKYRHVFVRAHPVFSRITLKYHQLFTLIISWQKTIRIFISYMELLKTVQVKMISLLDSPYDHDQCKTFSYFQGFCIPCMFVSIFKMLQNVIIHDSKDIYYIQVRAYNLKFISSISLWSSMDCLTCTYLG